MVGVSNPAPEHKYDPSNLNAIKLVTCKFKHAQYGSCVCCACICAWRVRAHVYVHGHGHAPKEAHGHQHAPGPVRSQPAGGAPPADGDLLTAMDATAVSLRQVYDFE